LDNIMFFVKVCQVDTGIAVDTCIREHTTNNQHQEGIR